MPHLTFTYNHDSSRNSFHSYWLKHQRWGFPTIDSCSPMFCISWVSSQMQMLVTRASARLHTLSRLATSIQKQCVCTHAHTVVCVCVLCACMCTCVGGVCAWMEWPEVYILYSTFFEAKSPWTWSSLIQQAEQADPGIHLCLPPQTWHCRHLLRCPAFYRGAETWTWVLI